MLDLPTAHAEAAQTTGARVLAFRWERDMLPPLAAAVGALAPPSGQERVHVLTEVASVSGVPDLVAVRFDRDAIGERRGAGLAPVTDLTQVRTLVAVADGGRTAGQLATAAQVTVAYMRGKILPALVGAGWLESITGRGCSAIVSPRHILRPLARNLITVEAKKAAWQRALNQAMRHAPSSDGCFIALDAARATPAIAQQDAIRKLGVGLLTVDPMTGRVTVVARPHRHPSDPVRRTVLAERAWQLTLTGQTAGPTFPVFGRDLTAI